MAQADATSTTEQPPTDETLWGRLTSGITVKTDERGFIIPAELNDEQDDADPDD